MFQIGFTAHNGKHPAAKENQAATGAITPPKKSVVRVHFPARNTTLSYFNEFFDLRRGDIVYVDGKMEGLRGCVMDVSYHFKIKLSDYKRVISVADTRVKGEFHFASSHFITFDRAALPYEKIITWFRAPEKADEIYASGNDESTFQLNDLSSMKISSSVAERGHDYFMENRVCYMTVDGTHGQAIVEGSHPYELEFEYHGGEIRNLTCTCFCSYPCKHEFAAMLQLKELLEIIEKNYSGLLEESCFFAAVCKSTLLNFAVNTKETGSFIL